MTIGLYPFWLLVIDWTLRLAGAIHLIWRRRPVTTTLAWLVVILFVPVFGLLLYAIVGESRFGLRRARRHERLTKHLETEALRSWVAQKLTTEPQDIPFGHIAQYGTAISGTPPLRGNRLALLADNMQFIAALKAEIDAAQNHIHLLFYIWTQDSGGRLIGEALIAAAKRGVSVRVLVDGIGSRAFLKSELCREMTGGGVRVVEALPVRLWRLPFKRLDLRNHRKIAVFDGRVAYCGSQNIHDTSFRSRAWRKTGQWIDASVRVEGPAAQSLAVTFLRDWQLDSEEDILHIDAYLPKLSIGDDAESIVQVIPSGPGPTPMAIHQALLTTIYSAQKELVMTTPYFVPDEAMLEALCAAAVRGVRVVLVVPEISDSPLVAAAARSHYLDMLESGIEIWQYRGGVLHSKTVTMDGAVGLIGSTNMDQRSFFLNFEVTLFAYDADFATVLRSQQMDYLSKSMQVHLDAWRKRPPLDILKDNAAQLLGPLL